MISAIMCSMNTITLPISTSPGYPGQPDPFQPNPGQTGLGGERFDTEGLNFATANDKFYVSLTASYQYGAYSSVWNYTYREGDLFFGFDGDDATYAIVTRGGASKLYQVDSYLTIPSVPGGFGNNAAIVASMGPWRINQGTELGEVQNAYTFYDDLEPNPIIPANPSQTNGDTWVKEYASTLARLVRTSIFANSQTVNFRITIECGNDLVEGNPQRRSRRNRERWFSSVWVSLDSALIFAAEIIRSYIDLSKDLRISEVFFYCANRRHAVNIV